MSVAWDRYREGQHLDDEEIEELYEWAERMEYDMRPSPEKPKWSTYDWAIAIVIACTGIFAAWALASMFW